MAAPDPFERRIRSRLDALKSDGLWRTLRPPQGVDLSSNDYLGLSRHPDVQASMVAAVGDEGCGSTGSRLLRGERAAFHAVEQRFAAFKQTDRALLFSSGYLANLAVLTTFPEKGDLILSDALNHASLIDGIRLSAARCLVFPHRDVAAAAALIEQHGEGQQVFLVTESLFSMDGDEAPLEQYAELCRDTGSRLIVDEAHAVGVFGLRGTGLIEESGTGDDVFLSVNTGGKALGVGGAFVAGPGWAIDYLTQRSRPFIFSTAPPPSMAAALDASLTVIEQEPERRAALFSQVRRMRRAVEALGGAILPGRSQIVPVLIGENDRALAVAERLQDQGFDVRAVRPPTVPVGTARLRVTVNIGIDDTTVDRFASALAAALESAPCHEASS